MKNKALKLMQMTGSFYDELRIFNDLYKCWKEGYKITYDYRKEPQCQENKTSLKWAQASWKIYV